MSWNYKTGVYITPVMFNPNWQDDIDKLQIGDYGEFVTPGNQAAKRKVAENFKFISFKSIDGTNHTIKPYGDKGEYVSDYQWTPAYYSSPNLRKVIDWFQAEKTKVRIFRQKPSGFTKLHFDWDNKRLNFNESEHIIRSWVPLNGENCWYRFSNGTSDITLSLRIGQVLFSSTDFVCHQTENLGSVPRDCLNITLKVNSWLKNFRNTYNQITEINL